MVKNVFVILFCFILIACSSAPTTLSVPITTPTLNLDPEMESAFQEARNTLNVFTEKIKTPHPDRTYVAVKVRFFPPDTLPQDIWVDGVTYQDGVFHGNFGDDIPSLKLSFGENIVIHTKDILDWMLVEDGKLIGGYTIRLAYQRMTPDEKERFLKTLDYSLDN